MARETNIDRVIKLVRREPGLDDDKISVLTGVKPRNQVNRICNDLAKLGKLRRIQGPKRKLINQWIGAESSEPDLDDQQSGADSMKHPLNQILYGPPGTGKTWNTVNHAVAIIEDKSVAGLEREIREEVKEQFKNDQDNLEREIRKKIRKRFNKLKKDGRIAMVTFHQNFTYEDFIEGIRPVLDDEDRNIKYELSEGVFKKIADRANKNRTQSEQTDDKSWDTDELLQAFAESIEERLESGEEINLFFPTTTEKSRLKKYIGSKTVISNLYGLVVA